MHYDTGGRYTACYIDHHMLCHNNPKLVQNKRHGEPGEVNCPVCSESSSYQHGAAPKPKVVFGWSSIGRGLRVIIGLVWLVILAFGFYIGVPWVLDHIGTKEEKCPETEVCNLAQGGTNAGYELCYCP